MTTMTRTDFFKHKSPGGGGLAEDPILRHLDHAYSLAGLPSPNPLKVFEDMLSREADIGTTTTRALNQALESEAPAKWFAESIKGISRAMAAEELRKAFRLHRGRLIVASKHALIKQALVDLDPYFTQVTTDLVEAANNLPSGDPLNPEIVFSLDATHQYKIAVDCLKKLGVLASLWRVNGQAVGGPAGGALTVVRVPECAAPLEIDRLTSRPLEEITPERAQVREFCSLANSDGADSALMAVAQGRWSHLSFSLPHEGWANRLKWAEMAISSLRSDSWR